MIFLYENRDLYTDAADPFAVPNRPSSMMAIP